MFEVRATQMYDVVNSETGEIMLNTRDEEEANRACDDLEGLYDNEEEK